MAAPGVSPFSDVVVRPAPEALGACYARAIVGASGALDRSACDRARIARDARFDGRFFTGVLTTRIYCRPTCPVKPARSRNVVFFPTAAAAERAGFRPCLRCRPEAAPGTPAWRGAAATVTRALRLIEGVPRRRPDGGEPGRRARHDRASSATALRAPRRRLTACGHRDATGAAREDAGGRDHAADGLDRVRRRLRQHPALQRRVPCGVPAAAQLPAAGAGGTGCDRIAPSAPSRRGKRGRAWIWGWQASTRS